MLPALGAVHHRQPRPRRVLTAILVMGFSGLVAEILLLRELLIVFSGNELSIGIILANWLILEASGCYFLGRRAERPGDKLAAFTLITVLFSLALILAVFLTRSLKVLLGISIGESIGFVPMFFSSLLILLPVSMLHGALFTYSCRIYADASGPSASTAGRVYVYETLGTIIGGVAFTYLLIPYLDAFQVTVGLALLNLVVCLVLLTPLRRGRPSSLLLPALLVVVALVAGWSLLSGKIAGLHQYSIQVQWQKLNVKHYQNSPYGNICVIENEGQYIYFLDGVAAIIAPIPDIPLVEKFVNIPLLAHPYPRQILILSGGAGGVINEALKHPSLARIDYAEQDPLLLDLLRRFPTELTESELGDPRVRIHPTDGRLLLQTTRERYDLIFVGVAEPANLQTNRYFTEEFFALARNRLAPEGILVFGLPGSLTFLSDELRNLNGSIYSTLGSVFEHVRVIPGDGRNLFLASAAPQVAKIDAEQILVQVLERDIDAEGLMPWHVEQKLHEGWQDWFLDFIAEGSRQPNRDFKPLGMFYNLTHWNALHSPGFGKFYQRFEAVSLPGIALLSALVLGACLLVRKISPRGVRLGIPLAIVSTGFAGMIFSLVVIFAFQAIYGSIFSWIGLLVAAFMTGAAVGAMLINNALERIRNPMKLFRTTELAVILFTLGLPLLIIAVHGWTESESAFGLLRLLFLVVSLLSGVLVGAQFPLANHIYLGGGSRLSETAALLYTADLLGGWLGGIVGGVVLLPVLGLFGTCMAVILLKVVSFIIVSTEPAGLYQEVDT